MINYLCSFLDIVLFSLTNFSFTPLLFTIIVIIDECHCLTLGWFNILQYYSKLISSYYIVLFQKILIEMVLFVVLYWFFPLYFKDFFHRNFKSLSSVNLNESLETNYKRNPFHTIKRCFCCFSQGKKVSRKFIISWNHIVGRRNLIFSHILLTVDTKWKFNASNEKVSVTWYMMTMHAQSSLQLHRGWIQFIQID